MYLFAVEALLGYLLTVCRGIHVARRVRRQENT